MPVSAPALGAAPTTPTTRGLSGQVKAAIIVRLLLAEGENVPLSDLPANLQEELIHQMAGLRHVDHATMTNVVSEFLAAFGSSGLSFPGALEETLSLMEGSISAETSGRIRAQAGLSASDPWVQICALEVAELLPLLEAESIEVAAVVLSKLKVAKAAELLGELPGERARRITYAVSLTGDIAPSVVRLIGLSLAEQVNAVSEREFDEAPVDRVGAILNFSPAATREDVLDALDQTDAEFAAEVRKAIFTFANIPERLNPLDVPKITKEVDPAILVMALAGAAGADAPAVEFILANMSGRMADQLREEIEELGKVKPKDAEAAMTSVVIAVRELADRGEITLIVESEEDDEA